MARVISFSRVYHSERSSVNGKHRQDNCRTPDDRLSKHLWKLAIAREGMGQLLLILPQQQP